MSGEHLDPSQSSERLQQLREAADAILDLREAFLDLLMETDADFSAAVHAEAIRCLLAASR